MNRSSLSMLFGLVTILTLNANAYAQDEGAEASSAEVEPSPTQVEFGGSSNDSFMFGAPSDDTVFVSTGYSGALRAGYMTSLSEGFSWGGEFIL
ncbi:MAG: hypothetical protein AAFV29_10290, partial [Myxococcota bacterium]